MDSAKAIGLGALYDGDVWDFFEHKTPITQMLPLGVISTIPATGSEASDTSVMTNDDGQIKRHIADIILRPSFAILTGAYLYTSALSDSCRRRGHFFTCGRALFYTGAGCRLYRQTV